MKKILTVILVSSLLLHSAFSIAQQGNRETVSLTSEQHVKVNINNAPLAQLTSLKGVGEKKASAIISFRNAHGAFNQVDDLLKVKGIGEKVLKDNLNRITI